MFDILLKRFKRFNLFKKPGKAETEKPAKEIFEINFEEFQKSIHYNIIDRSYFITALTHRSFLKVKNNPLKIGIISNERLEFLGDAVLDLVVAEYLFKNFPLNEEGDLTKFRSILVNKKFLAERAKIYVCRTSCWLRILQRNPLKKDTTRYCQTHMNHS